MARIRTPPAWRWDGGGSIARAYAAGRGILFLTPHLGGFEASPQALAADYGPRHGPMTILYRPARQPWLARTMAAARGKCVRAVIPTPVMLVKWLVSSPFALKPTGRSLHTHLCRDTGRHT